MSAHGTLEMRSLEISVYEQIDGTKTKNTLLALGINTLDLGVVDDA